MGGEQYDYAYEPQTRTVYTQMFDQVPVQCVHLRCGTVIKHDDLRMLIENKLKAYEMLENSF
ncbi:hypothetical protein EBR43_05640 [bacterium]|nr:hypothetical protein [bacterium]